MLGPQSVQWWWVQPVIPLWLRVFTEMGDCNTSEENCPNCSDGSSMSYYKHQWYHSCEPCIETSGKYTSLRRQVWWWPMGWGDTVLAVYRDFVTAALIGWDCRAEDPAPLSRVWGRSSGLSQLCEVEWEGVRDQMWAALHCDTLWPVVTSRNHGHSAQWRHLQGTPSRPRHWILLGSSQLRGGLAPGNKHYIALRLDKTGRYRQLKRERELCQHINVTCPVK